MAELKYKVITSKTLYREYCDALERLLQRTKDQRTKEEIALLTLLIETWDKEHATLPDSDPVELLKYLMEEHDLNSIGLSQLLGVSKGLVSDILNYKKGFSKEVIRKLADHFKVTQEAFNVPYKLKLGTGIATGRTRRAKAFKKATHKKSIKNSIHQKKRVAG